MSFKTQENQTNQTHQYWMQKAIDLAKKANNSTYPNPRVGCIIVKNNQCIGKGYHQQAGGLHAEINALQNTSESPKDATIYITLEPCCHTGKTPPCADAVIKSGIKTAIIAQIDPSQHTNGKGIKKLKDAGILVTQNILKEKAQALNFGFLKRIKTNMPWFCAKTATSLNGSFVHQNQFITNSKARAHIHLLRARTHAILTGSQTILKDNPKLNIRPSDEFPITQFTQPQLIVLDTHGKITPDYQIFKTQRPILILSQNRPQKIYPDHVKHIQVPKQAKGMLSFKAILEIIKEQPIDEVMIESGPSILHEFLSQKLIDEWWYYLAPKWITPALHYPKTLKQYASEFQIQNIKTLDNNLLIRLLKQPSPLI